MFILWDILWFVFLFWITSLYFYSICKHTRFLDPLSAYVLYGWTPYRSHVLCYMSDFMPLHMTSYWCYWSISRLINIYFYRDECRGQDLSYWLGRRIDFIEGIFIISLLYLTIEDLKNWPSLILYWLWPFFWCTVLW